MKGGAAVADEETTETSEDDGPTTAELDAKVTGLESKVDLILDKLSGTKDQAHAAAQQHTEDRLDRPTSIAEEIRAQLEQTRAREAEAADRKNSADRLAAVEERVSGMAEKTPESPLRPITRLMWGAR